MKGSVGMSQARRRHCIVYLPADFACTCPSNGVLIVGIFLFYLFLHMQLAVKMLLQKGRRLLRVSAFESKMERSVIRLQTSRKASMKIQRDDASRFVKLPSPARARCPRCLDRQNG